MRSDTNLEGEGKAMWKILVIAMLWLLLPLARAATPSPGIQVSEAWTRATAPHAPSAVGYLTLTNTGTRADRLISASSPAAARVELHESRMDGGVMRMRKLDGLDLPAGASVTLAPGGTHLMLIGPTQPLVAGQAITLTLRFAHAPPQNVQLQVRPLGVDGPGGQTDGMQHMHGLHGQAR